MAEKHDIKALQGFLAETNDSLQDIESAFIQLENNPTDLAIINKIFRPVHSMKGNSGFFGLANINKFAHRLEDLLEYIRKGELVVDREVIDILLTGTDFLQQMLARIAEDPSNITLRAEEEQFLKEKVAPCRPAITAGSRKSIVDLENLLTKAEEEGFDMQKDPLFRNVFDQIEKLNKDLQKHIDDHAASRASAMISKTDGFFYQGKEHTDIIQCFRKVINRLLQSPPVDKEHIATYKTSIETLRGILKHEERAGEVLNELHSLGRFLDDELLAANREFQDSFCTAIGDILSFFEIAREEIHDSPDEALLGKILVEQNMASEEDVAKALKKQERLGQILIKDGTLKGADLKQALDIQNRLAAQRHMQQKTGPQTTKTIRINQAMLDKFAESVGDLFINIDSFNYLRNQLGSEGTATETLSKFTQTVTALDDLAARLQNDVMDIRRVPVKTLVQRFPRIIRQLSASLGKEIEFRINGEDTVIDKDLLENIENPLVHLLRNAVDHAIELPDERIAKGKPARGLLELTISVDENNVYLEIKDDGKGIDPATIKRVAIAKGFMTEEELEELSEKELIDLIFKPGFSSAEKVSDVSGRGVGMDVVRSVLEKNSGTIVVDSKIDQGTVITMQIPLTRTLVTKDALIVKSSDQYFAIPSEEITTTMYPENNLVNLLSDEKGISYNGAVMRVIDVNDYFYFQPSDNDRRMDNQVLIICEKRHVALLVDQTFNHQQIVVKVFKDAYKQLRNIPGIYGYTVLGNEDVVLIIDVEKIGADTKVMN